MTENEIFKIGFRRDILILARTNAIEVQVNVVSVKFRSGSDLDIFHVESEIEFTSLIKVHFCFGWSNFMDHTCNLTD